MKKFICILAVIAIMLSSVTAVFAADAVNVGLGETKELLAKDYAINAGAMAGYSGTYFSNQDAIYGGNIWFKIIASEASEAKLTVEWLPNDVNNKSDFIAFFNPCKAPSAGTVTTELQAGVDYPARADAVIDIKKADFDTSARANFDINNPVYLKHTVVVNLKEGDNTFWIPSYCLRAREAVTGADGNVSYKNADNAYEPYDGANGQISVHALTVEVPETGVAVPDTVTVYVKELAKSNLSTASNKKTINGLNKSYVNVKEPDNEYGYTNYANGGDGDSVKFPFNVAKTGKYKLKVYYATPFSDSIASLHLDGSTEVITSGKWINTGHSVFINNGGTEAQLETEPQSYIKAPFFAIKTFDLGTLNMGLHSVKFVQEVINGNRNNNRLLINRIEVIPEAMAKTVEINTYSYNYVGWKGDVSATMWSHLFDVKTARNYIDFNLSAQFINNSGEVKSYQPILGFYANGELVNVKMENLVTLPAAENETVTINCKVITNELADNVDTIKLFVWENDMITPAHEVTALVD